MQSIYGVILTAVVVALLVVTVVIPITQTSSNVSYETADNTGYDYLMSKGSSSYSTTITYVSAGTFTVGGESLALSEGQSRVWVSDAGIIYLSSSSSYALLMGRSGGSVAATSFGSSEGTLASVTFSAGTMTADMVSGSQITQTYTYVMHPDASGDWAFFSGNAFRISEGGHFYSVGLAQLRLAAGYGTADSMSQAVSRTGYSTTWTVASTAQETYSAVSGVTVVATDVSETPRVDMDVIGSIAPVEYNSAVAQDSITITDTMVSIIPLILIVGVIVMAVSYIVRRND